jgi:hypothetical protein
VYMFIYFAIYIYIFMFEMLVSVAEMCLYA